MSRGPDAGTLLERALLASAGRAGCPVAVEGATMTRWASVTFTGAQHRLTLAGPASAALDLWLAGLPDTELALRGHLVADLGIEAIERDAGRAIARIEALTVEERG